MHSNIFMPVAMNTKMLDMAITLILPYHLKQPHKHSTLNLSLWRLTPV